MEIGIGARAGIGAGLKPPRTDAPQRAVTEHILSLADQSGFGAALIDAAAAGSGEASVITWPQFARMVRAAARGLSRRGLAEADTAGIFVQDAASHVLAVHAVRAAGAIAAPVRPAQAAADIAAQLKRCRARLLITSAGLAELAVQAAERSWVRQVFAFGEAEGTTPFGSLLHTARHGQLQASGSTSHDGANGSTSHDGANGSTGHDGATGSNGHHGGRAAAQALGLAGLDAGLDSGLDLAGATVAGLRLAGSAPRLTYRDVVVAAPPCGDPATYTALLDLALAAGATLVAAPLPQVAAAVAAYKGTAAIVPGGAEVPGLPAERVFGAA